MRGTSAKTPYAFCDKAPKNRLSPECQDIHVEQRESSLAINRLVPVEAIVFSGMATPLATLSMTISEEPSRSDEW